MRILVCGDSWGCGEHYDVTPKIPSKFGIDYFLSNLGHSTKNISAEGASNMMTIRALEKENLEEYDYIFLFYTNPFRDTWTENLLDDYTSCAKQSLNYNNYIEIYEKCVINFYNNLEKFKKTIYIIGGHNKIEDKFLNSKYIINFIPSVREFFYLNFIDDKIVFPNQYFNDILDRFNRDAIEKIHLSRVKLKSLPDIHKKYFSQEPYHLDREGYEILSNYINNFINR